VIQKARMASESFKDRSQWCRWEWPDVMRFRSSLWIMSSLFLGGLV